jgi:hypothetical protein
VREKEREREREREGEKEEQKTGSRALLLPTPLSSTWRDWRGVNRGEGREIAGHAAPKRTEEKLRSIAHALHGEINR